SGGASGVVESGFRSYVHDGAAPLLEHRANRSTRKSITRAKIQAQHLLEHLCFHLPQFQTACVPADRIHHHIQATVLGKGFFDELRGSGFVGNIDYVTLEPGSVCTINGLDAHFARFLLDEGHGPPAKTAAAISGDYVQFIEEGVVAVERKTEAPGQNDIAEESWAVVDQPDAPEGGKRKKLMKSG